MGVEIRKVDEPVYDGTTGAEVDTITRYEIGGEVDGAWVSFASKSGEHVERLVEQARQSQKDNPQQSGDQQGDTGAPQNPAVPTEPQSNQQS